MNQFLQSNGFWSLVGILIGSCIGFVFSVIQRVMENGRDQYKLRVEKMEEICDSLNLLNEKITRIRNTQLSKEAYIAFWHKNPDFWTDIPFIKIRMQVCTFFPKALKHYDELQVVISNFVKYVTSVTESGEYSLANILDLNKQLIAKRNLFVNAIVDRYLKR